MKQEIMLRNSERSTYRRCRMLWKWTYLDKQTPLVKKPALQLGSLVHESLAAWYKPGTKRGPHPAKTFKKLHDASPIAFGEYDAEGNKVSSYDLGMALLEGYVDKYGKEEHIEIIQPEKAFQIDLMDKNGKLLLVVVGEFDTVFRNLETGRIGLHEHKTAKAIKYVRINSGYGEQALGYNWAANIILRDSGVLKKKESVDHVLFNFLRKALPDDRPVNEQGVYLNKDGTVSKKQPPPLFDRQVFDVAEHNLATYEDRLRKDAWEMVQARNKKLPLTKNPTMDCDWCAFRDVCEVHEMGGDYEGIFEMEFGKWDPYEAHSLKEEKVK